MIGILENIHLLIARDMPPEAEKKSYCRSCAYFEFCWVWAWRRISTWSKNGKIVRKQNTLYFISKKEGNSPPASPGEFKHDGVPGYLAEGEDEEYSDLPEDISDKPEFEKRPLAIEQIDSILCYGRVSLTSGVISFLSKYSIPVHFFGYYGYYESTLYPKEAMLSGEMHVRQASHYLDRNKRLVLARKFVIGSAANIKRNLEYYWNQEKSLSDILNNVDSLVESVNACDAIGQLLALEGNIRSTYYSAFDRILKDDFSFGG